jgi:hypothetical protein
MQGHSPVRPSFPDLLAEKTGNRHESLLRAAFSIAEKTNTAKE